MPNTPVRAAAEGLPNFTSDDLDELTGDLRNLATLIGVVTNISIDAIAPDRTVEDFQSQINTMSNLLWIAREIVERAADNSEAANRRVLAERNRWRMVEELKRQRND